MMITGDYGLTAESIARRIGMLSTKNTHLITGSEIDGMDDETLAQLLSQEIVFSRMAPEHKLRIVNLLKAQGEIVAFIGDGVNDTPAIRAADVGIAMGCGADVSREAADVCLLSSNLTHLVTAIELARRTVRVLRQNLFWAFFYNVVGIGLACAGKLNPMWAAAAMTLSSIIVVANSLRLGAITRSEPARQVPQSPVSSALPCAQLASPKLTS